jgi:enterochelin esterase family protein
MTPGAVGLVADEDVAIVLCVDRAATAPRSIPRRAVTGISRSLSHFDSPTAARVRGRPTFSSFASWTAWRHPEVFQKVGSRSGCFTAAPREGGPDASYYRDPEWLAEHLSQEPARAIRFYVDTGQIEWLLAPNRRFAAVLAGRGYPHCYGEHPS